MLAFILTTEGTYVATQAANPAAAIAKVPNASRVFDVTDFSEDHLVGKALQKAAMAYFLNKYEVVA